jgi:hypothetical protein
MHLAGGVVVGNVERDGGHGQIRIARQVMVGQDDMAQMLAIGGHEPVAPFIGGQPKLPAAGGGLQAAGHVGLEADAAAAQGDLGRLGVVHALDGAALAAGVAMDPVVQPPLKTAQ